MITLINNNWLILSKVFIIAWFITDYTPIAWVMNLIKPLFFNKILKITYDIILLATGCIKCCSFYVGWIIGGLYIGIIASFIAYLYSNLIQPKIEKITFQ